uniref:Ribosomal RNA methyltransferase FtsJ domain-containing protein n=1 Tax=viral metagenome TaxID=1070528 RepID=A0A6C0E7F5_9ZZZZ
MNYYILPKNKNTIIFNIEFRPFSPQLYISHSLHNYILKLIKLINSIISNNICDSSNNSVVSHINQDNNEQFDNIKNIINPYKFIYSNVPNTSISVSKLKPFSNTFYDFIEITKSLNIFELYAKTKIKSLLFGENSYAIMECMDIIREDYNDNYNYINDFKNYYFIINSNDIQKNSIDFLFYDLFIENIDDKIANPNYNIIIKILHSIFCYQNIHGVCIIKAGDLFYKPIIDLLYILSNSYNNIYIIKPITCDITNNEKYIVCKDFCIHDNNLELYTHYLIEFIKTDNILLDDIINKNMNSKDFHLHNIIKNDIPIHFLNKIEELNIIFGNSQLDAYNLMLNLLKHKDKDEKIDSIKKINIQKSIHWCEKNNIPHNKFIEKLNIFYNHYVEPTKK